MQTLQQLAQYIQHAVPRPDAILNLRFKEAAHGVVFSWQGVEFFVNLSLHAFEVRGHTLYITGLSSLLQTVIGNRTTERQKWAALFDQLSEAEMLLLDGQPVRRAVEIIREVREGARRHSITKSHGAPAQAATGSEHAEDMAVMA